MDTNVPFSGTVEGNNNTISNLWIDKTGSEGDYQGLFGQITSGSLSDIKIDGANLNINDTSGTLAGDVTSNSTIDNCHVTNYNLTGNSYNCGGLVGALLSVSSVSNSSASGDINSINQIGGLVGTVFLGATISNSYSEGTVTAGYLAGGLVGYCTVNKFGANPVNVIDNSYSRANIVVINGRAGGLFGGSDGALLLKNSYSTGTVTAPEYQGAVIGAFGGGGIVIENTYFDTESSELTEAVGGFTGPTQNYDIEGKTTAEMKSQAVVDLLNSGSSDNPWTLDANENDGYPILNQTLSTTQPEEIKLALSIYPTVADSKINISTQLDLETFKVYNYSGQIVLDGKIENKTIQVNTLSEGVYLLNIMTEQGAVTHKFIKK